MNPFLAGPILVWQARERLHEVRETRVELRIRISKDASEKLRRVQDLESLRTYRSVTVEEALEAAVNTYLDGPGKPPQESRVA